MKSPILTWHTSSTTQLKLKNTRSPEQDVRAVVAKERRLHPDGVASRAEQLPQDSPARVLLVALAGGVQVLAQIPGPLPGLNQFRIERVVELAGQHFFAFARHDAFHYQVAQHGCVVLEVPSPKRRTNEHCWRAGSGTQEVRVVPTGYARTLFIVNPSNTMAHQ